MTAAEAHVEYAELADAIARHTDLPRLARWNFTYSEHGHLLSLVGHGRGRDIAIHGERGHLANYRADNGLWAFTIATGDFNYDMVTETGYDELADMLDDLADMLLNRPPRPKSRPAPSSACDAYGAFIAAVAAEYQEAIDFLNRHFAGRLSWSMMQVGGMNMAIGADCGNREIRIGGINGPLADRRALNGRWTVGFCDWATGGNDSQFNGEHIASLSELAVQIEQGLRSLDWPEAPTSAVLAR